jgi:RNA polymerase sigma-70 factor (ECF subfamily)
MAETASRQDFGEFYSSSAARLVRHGYALTGDMAEAQDIAQEAFARAWQRWPVVRACDSPEAWVRRVATNLAASRWRRIRVARAAAGQAAEQHTPEVSTDTVALVSGLRTLPERQRTVLVLHYMCDLTVDQIAAELGCPPGSVKSWLSRGRTALAAAVRIVEPEPEPDPQAERDARSEQRPGAEQNGQPPHAEEAARGQDPEAADLMQPDNVLAANGSAPSELPEPPGPSASPDPSEAPVLLAASANGRGAERAQPRPPRPARPQPEASHA